VCATRYRYRYRYRYRFFFFFLNPSSPFAPQIRHHTLLYLALLHAHSLAVASPHIHIHLCSRTCILTRIRIHLPCIPTSSRVSLTKRASRTENAPLYVALQHNPPGGGSTSDARPLAFCDPSFSACSFEQRC
jgi:hypothetical protein